VESDALRNIRTMRQIKTSLDVAREQKVRTTNSLSKTKEETEYLESIKHPQLNKLLTKERKRLAAFDASVENSRRRLLRSRERLASIINKNRTLMKLRHQLQQAHWTNDPDSPLSKTNLNSRSERFCEVELDY
jgi:molecular chaperone GrpE (heat shock protein)